MSATKKKAAPAPEKNGFEEYTAKATASVQENMEKFSTAAAEMGDLTRENFEAVVESATTYARGVEEIATEQANFTREAMESGVEQIRKVSAAKTPQEFLEVQTEYLRGAFEANMNQFNKMSELWVNTTRDAAEPLNKRYSAVVEKAQSFV